jgi:beta-phosphoglucomutase-like phosphatase (HAD superfamily)
LVIEDSLSGVKTALAARMGYISVSTPFTRASLHNDGVLEDRLIVDNTDHLLDVINEFVELKITWGEGKI